MAHEEVTAFVAEAEKAIAFMHSEFSKLQTGRASAALVEHIHVDSYGQKSELRTIASVSVQDASTLTIQPWDKSILAAVEKAIQQADLGVNPVNDGNVIRINLPPMTEERRQKLTKIVSEIEEEAKIKVRQHRHEAQSAIKEEADEDDRERGLKELQAATEKINKEIEESAKKKTADIMAI